MTHGEKAKELFTKGYNCAQSVAAAFCDITGTDEKTMLMLSSSFGGGMGRMREVCGAVSGMFMVLGLLYGYSETEDRGKKAELYARVQHLAEQFRKENGSIICRELIEGVSGNDTDPSRPSERTAEYYKKRPCGELVKTAGDILEKYIQENPVFYKK